MKIAKFIPDDEGNISVPKCIAIVWVGVQKDTPTVMAMIGEENEGGRDLHLAIKVADDSFSLDEAKQFMGAFVTADIEYFLFGEKPSIIQASSANIPSGMSVPGRSFN